MASVQRLKQMIQNRPGPNPSLQRKLETASAKKSYLGPGIHDYLGAGPVTFGQNSQASNASGGPTKPRTPATNVPLPWDSAYESAVGAANLGYSNTDLGLNQKQQALEANYGFDPAYASDPMTQANLLQNAWDTSNRGSANSQAARGQLYSGSTTNALDTNRFNYLKGYDTAYKAYTGSKADIQQARLEAQAKKAGDIANAEGDRVSNAVQNAYSQALGESSGGLGGPLSGGSNKPTHKPNKPNKPNRKGKKK